MDCGTQATLPGAGCTVVPGGRGRGLVEVWLNRTSKFNAELTCTHESWYKVEVEVKVEFDSMEFEFGRIKFYNRIEESRIRILSNRILIESNVKEFRFNFLR
jgi:hypothetical protein